MTARRRLQQAWDRLDQLYGAVVHRRALDGLTDHEIRTHTWWAEHRIRCLCEGRNAGWWPRKGQLT